MSLADLIIENKKLVFFSGKGGVGKTTCASATALQLAAMGKKTLIISSDPAPSLSDIFETIIGDEEKPVAGAENLYALEISAESVLKRWKQKFGPQVYEVLSSFLPVEYEIIDYFAGAPGIEEEFMLDYIMELIEKGEYETIVWDTAPAGHTLHLLSLPQTLLKHLEAAAKVYMKLHGYLKKVAELSKIKKEKRSIFDIIDDWKNLSEKIMGLIRDENHTEFILVTIPEALSVYQTKRIIKFSREFGLPLKRLIINNVIQNGDCDFHRIQKKLQQEYLKTLNHEYGETMGMIEVPLSPYEIKGIDRIRGVSKILFS